jgi:hypothetical protein
MLKIVEIVKNNTILLLKMIIFKNLIDFCHFSIQIGLWNFENFVQVGGVRRSHN